jgi:hypothetical protein
MASLRERLMGLTSDSGNSFNTSYGPRAACREKNDRDCRFSDIALLAPSLMSHLNKPARVH